MLSLFMLVLFSQILFAQRPDSVPQKFERFSGAISAKGFAEQNTGVYIFNQIIGERQTLSSFQSPLKGLAIIQLRAGRLKTITDGKELKRAEGEIWTVAAHEPLQLSTDDDAATIQVIIVREDSNSSRKAKVPSAKKDSVNAAGFSSFGTGVVRRGVFMSKARSNFSVEIWDMMAAIGTRSSKIYFPGAAILEVRTGNARFIVDGKTTELKMGSTLVINEGSSLEIETQKEQKPVNFRAIVITANK